MRCFDAARAELRWAAAGAVDGSVASLSASPDASEVLAVGRTGWAAVLDLASGKVLRKFQVGLLGGKDALFALEGRSLAAGVVGRRRSSTPCPRPAMFQLLGLGPGAPPPASCLRRSD